MGQNFYLHAVLDHSLNGIDVITDDLILENATLVQLGMRDVLDLLLVNNGLSNVDVNLTKLHSSVVGIFRQPLVPLNGNVKVFDDGIHGESKKVATWDLQWLQILAMRTPVSVELDNDQSVATLVIVELVQLLEVINALQTVLQFAKFWDGAG